MSSKAAIDYRKVDDQCGFTKLLEHFCMPREFNFKLVANKPLIDRVGISRKPNGPMVATQLHLLLRAQNRHNLGTDGYEPTHSVRSSNAHKLHNKTLNVELPDVLSENLVRLASLMAPHKHNWITPTSQLKFPHSITLRPLGRIRKCWIYPQLLSGRKPMATREFFGF